MISYFEITRYFCAPKEDFCQTVFQGQACSTYWSSFKVSQGNQNLSIDFHSLHFSDCIPCNMISSVQSWHVLISPVSHLCLFASCALAQKMLEHTAVPTTCTQIKESLMSWFQSRFSPWRAHLDPARTGLWEQHSHHGKRDGKVTLNSHENSRSA